MTFFRNLFFKKKQESILKFNQAISEAEILTKDEVKWNLYNKLEMDFKDHYNQIFWKHFNSLYKK